MASKITKSILFVTYSEIFRLLISIVNRVIVWHIVWIVYSLQKYISAFLIMEFSIFSWNTLQGKTVVLR